MNDFPKELAPGVWALGNYYYTLYLVRGQDACALVEVGVSAGVDEVLRQLEELGARPDYLVVSHPHADHLTGLAGLTERFPDAQVLVAPGAREFAEHPKAALNLVVEDAYIHEIMEQKGNKPGRAPVQAPPSLDGSRVVRDGDVVELGGLSLHILEVKGHSPGNLAVHVPEADVLCVSDCLGIHYPGRRFFPTFFVDYTEFVENLDKLEAVGASTLGLGHMGPIQGPGAAREAFASVRLAARHILRRVRENASSTEDLAEQLFHEYYRDELCINSESNIQNCVKLLIRRCEAVPE